MLGMAAVSALTGGYMLASAGACPAPPQNPVFDLQVREQQAIVDQSMSAGQITQMKLHNDQEASASGDAAAQAAASHDAAVRQAMSLETYSFYNGLTQGRITGQTEYKIKPVPIGDGSQLCLYADTVTLTLSYDPVIYVAAEYADRPCADKVVRAHEALHVERDQQAIADFSPRAKQSMQDWLDHLGGLGPYPADQADAGVDALRDAVQGDLENGVLPALSLMRQQYQQGIDTPENYKMQSALCPAEDWLPAPPKDGQQ